MTKFRVAAVSLVSCVAAGTAVAADYNWISGNAGNWTDAANWLAGGEAAVVSPGDGDAVKLSATSGTVRFPGTVRYAGTWAAAIPSVSSSDALDMTFDATGSRFNLGKAAGTSSVSLFGTLNSNTDPAVYIGEMSTTAYTEASTNVSYLTDAVLRMRADETSSRFEVTGNGPDRSSLRVGLSSGRDASGTYRICGTAARTMTFAATGVTMNLKGFLLYNYSALALTNCTVIALGDLTLGPGSTGVNGGPAALWLHDVFWDSDKMGSGSGGAAFHIGSGKNSPSDAKAYLTGKTSIRTTNGNTGGGSVRSTVAAGASAKGLLALSDSASIYIQGKTFTSDYGWLSVASGSSSQGTLLLGDDTRLTVYSLLSIGAGAGSTAYVCISNNATVAIERASTAGYLPTITLGGVASKDCLLEICGNAAVSTTKVLANTNAAADFVRTELRLLGGTLTVNTIEGTNTLSMKIGDATIRAAGATTAEAPLIQDLASLTFTGAERLTIDTQTYDTYITNAFPATATIVKRGTGTLYVRNSGHLKTIVEEGAIFQLDAGGVFGSTWEFGPKATIRVPGEAGDFALMGFPAEGAATAWAEEVMRRAVYGASGYEASAVTVEQVGGVWRVKATVVVHTSGTRTWIGAAGAGWWWNSSAWDPTGTPDANDDAVIPGAATVALPVKAVAKTLYLTGEGVFTTTGTGEIGLATGLCFSNETTAAVKVVDVADDVQVKTPSQTAVNSAFAKSGSGTFTIEYTNTAKSTYSFNQGTTVDACGLSVRNGSLRLKGVGAVRVNGAMSSGSYLGTTPIGIGLNAETSGDLAELVFDKIGVGSDATYNSSLNIAPAASSTSPAEARLVMTNGAIFCGTMRVGYRWKSPGVASLYVTNAEVAVSASNTMQIGPYDSKNCSSEDDLTARVRIGSGGRIVSTAGGWVNGELWFGVGCDVRVEDGGYVDFPSASGDYGHPRGSLRAYSKAHGDVTIANGSYVKFGSVFNFNNYGTAVTAGKKLTFKFDNGTLMPAVTAATDANAGYALSRYALFACPEYQGFEALAGGMIVDMSAGSRYTFACPVRGVGELKKTGAGLLVLGTGRKFTATTTISFAMDSEATNDTAKVVESGVVTVQNAGGVHVAGGAVALEAGATDAQSAFTVDAGCTLDLGGNTVAVGTVGGAGTFANGTFNAVTFKAVAAGADVPTYANVTFAKRVTIDFGNDPANNVKVATIGDGVSGIAKGSTFTAKAVNTGSERRSASCTVDADGRITAVPSISGMMIIYR